MDSKKILPLVLIIVVSGVIATGLYLNNKSVPSQNSEATQSDKAYYIINKGEGDAVTYEISDVPADATVYSLLVKLAAENNFAITTTDYPSMGVLVNSIAGLQGGTNDKWWQYWINDVLGDVAADKKPVKKGDKVEWKFDVIPAF